MGRCPTCGSSLPYMPATCMKCGTMVLGNGMPAFPGMHRTHRSAWPRRIVGLVFLALFFTGGWFGVNYLIHHSSVATPTKPTLFTDPEHRFTAMFPGTPDRSEQQAPAADGTMLKEITYILTDGDKQYAVAYTDFPGSFDLHRAVQGSATKVNGTISSETDGTDHGFPSVDYTITTSTASVRGRDIVVNQTAYLILATGNPVPSDGVTFIDSFVPTPK